MKAFSRHKMLFAVPLILLSAVATGSNFSVDCNKGGTIGAVIAKITVHNPLGPNMITVTGACHENVNIASLDNLTLQAGPSGASISDTSGGGLDTVSVGDAQRFAMNGFTINGSVDCFDNAVCRTQGNTIQNSQVGYGLRYSRTHGNSIQDVIQNNNGAGVIVAGGSRVILAGDTVQNNTDDGIGVNAALLVLENDLTATTITNNGNNGVLARDHATVRLFVANITANGNDGVRLLEDAVLRLDFVAPAVNSIINNANSGVHVGDQSFAFFAGGGSSVVTGNLSGTDVLCSGQFPATRGALTNIAGGTTNCTEPAPLTDQGNHSESRDGKEIHP